MNIKKIEKKNYKYTHLDIVYTAPIATTITFEELQVNMNYHQASRPQVPTPAQEPQVPVPDLQVPVGSQVPVSSPLVSQQVNPQ